MPSLSHGRKCPCVEKKTIHTLDKIPKLSFPTDIEDRGTNQVRLLHLVHVKCSEEKFKNTGNVPIERRRRSWVGKVEPGMNGCVIW